jgi:RNA polymerase sigma-70 factor (ECF subfamily)
MLANPETNDFFREIVRDHGQSVLAHVQRLVGAQEAEDVVQDVFLLVYRSLDGFEGNASVRSWLFRITHNACMSHLRKRKLRRQWSRLFAPDEEAEEASPDPLAQLERKECLQALDQGIAALPAKESMALTLFYVEECDYAQIAEAMCISQGTVATLLHRARHRLRNVVGTDYQERQLCDTLTSEKN